MKVRITRIDQERNTVAATVSHKGIICDVAVPEYNPAYARLTLHQRLQAEFYNRLELVVEDIMMEAFQKVKSNRA